MRFGKHLIVYTTINDSLTIYYHGLIYPPTLSAICKMMCRREQTLLLIPMIMDHASSGYFAAVHIVTLETFRVKALIIRDD